MRPVRLQMKGFGAFREFEEVDFSDVDYIALVGPTGSGKSTIIDAMCFALYGSVPRYENENRVGYAVTTGATEARVSFTFDAGGRRYTATRVVQRKPDGRAQTREARLEVETGTEGATEVLAGSVRSLDALVRDHVLGMEFDHFKRCVVLPQGEFARFLTDKPRDRQDMLVRLLGLEVYARMGQRANQLKAERERQAGQLTGEAAALAFATPEAAAALTARITELEKLNQRLEGARLELGELSRRSQEASRAASEAETLAAALEAVRLPAEARRAGAQIRHAREAEDAAAARVAAVAAELTGTEARLGELGDRAVLDGARDRYEQLEKLEPHLAEAGQAVRQARAAAAEATRLLAEATAAETARQAELEELRLAHRAHFLAERLAVGAPCPVCRQEVVTLPELSPLPAGELAKRAHAGAQATTEAARQRDGRARQGVAAAEERRRGLTGRQEQLRAELSGAPARRDVDARLAAVDEAAAAAALARQAEAAERRALDAARAARTGAEEAVGRLWHVLDGVRDGLAALSPPPLSRRDIAEDWAALAAWAVLESPRRRQAQQSAAAQAAEHRAAADRLLGDLTTTCAEVGVHHGPGAVGLDGLTRAGVRAEETARAELAGVTRARARLEELSGALSQAEEDATVARELARHLGSRGFERWLLAEVLDGLVSSASVILGELSSGAYSLATEADGEFSVIDHRNADERRSAKTLSGGETFQASLALALALAEQLSSLAAAGAARIEATFIDEGFGSLDQDTLETVAGTLENMGGDDRLVGIVTHVRDLAERVPVRLEITRGPRTASVTKVVA